MTGIKSALWRLVFDPLVRKIESRLDHYRSLRSVTHDGSKWADRAVVGKGNVFYAEAELVNQSAPNMLRIGDYSHVRGEVSVQAGGEFLMGSHCFLGPGSRIWCKSRVTIGNHVLISHLVDIHDSDSHSMNWQQRRQEGIRLFEQLDDTSSPHVAREAIVIQDDVWIGFKSSVFKGVTIGRGSVVAACSVVTHDVPPFTLVAGNPARILRELEQ
ncbi:acyltransferase [Caenimonas koreensis]|uniref:acyltransferase n=1 Tax=Caenimonas koreensis TaxID=367474 RepID=UPI003782D6DA